MTSYTVSIALEADSMEAARKTVEGWELGEATVVIIVSQPEQWAPPAPEAEPPEADPEPEAPESEPTEPEWPYVVDGETASSDT